MKTYKTKDLIIEAIQFTQFNGQTCMDFCSVATYPENTKSKLVVSTPIGEVECGLFDWIVKDEDGDFYVTDSDNEMWNRYELIKDNTTIGQINQFKVKPTTVQAIQYYIGKNYKEISTLVGIPTDGNIDKETMEKYLNALGLSENIWVMMYPDSTLGMLKHESFQKQFELIDPSEKT